MSNTVNFSFSHKPVNNEERVNATITKRNGVLDFKSILLSAEDGTLDDAKASEKEAIRQLIANREGAVDFLKSRNFFTLDRFPPGTTAVAAANLVFEAEFNGAPLTLAPLPPQRLPGQAVFGTPSSAPQVILDEKFEENLKKALTTLKDEYALFDLKDFPAGINAIQAVNYIQSGYGDVAKALIEGEFKTTGLAVFKKFADDVPSVKRFLNDDQSQLRANVKPELRALQLLQEEEAAKVTLLERFKINFDKLEPPHAGTAIGLLRLKLGGGELPSVAEAKAMSDLRDRLDNSEVAVNNLLARFPAGTTASQVLSYWDLTARDKPEPTPPPLGTNLNNLLNRLAADVLVQKGIYNLNSFPPKTTTLQAWQLVDSGQTVPIVREQPSVQGPRVEGTAGIIKIRTPKSEMAKLPIPKVVEPAQVVLKGFDVVNQMVQWGVEIDPNSKLDLATISQQGITRDALRAGTRPLPKPIASVT